VVELNGASVGRTLHTLAIVATVGLMAWAGAAQAQEPSADPAERAIALTNCRSSTAPKPRELACAAAEQNPLLKPDDLALAHFFRAMALWDQSRFDDAKAELLTATSLDLDLWPAYWFLGQRYFNDLKFEEAASSWSVVIAHNPTLAGAYERRGMALDHAGREAEAATDFTRAIELAGPARIKAPLFADRGEALIGTFELDKARADFDQASHFDEHEIRAYFGRGRIAYLTGDFDTATEQFMKLSALSPDFPYAPLWLFLAQSRAGKEAKAALRKWADGKDLKPWPGALVRLYLGELTVEQFDALPMPASAYPPDELCEKAFYLAELARIHGHRTQATALLRAAVATDVKYFIEYQAAAYELDHPSR